MLDLRHEIFSPQNLTFFIYNKRDQGNRYEKLGSQI